jgi:mannitol/fructose-specific phosphotransferase system IIA component (Ntr-type)
MGLSIAAILAFLSTANAGIMTAARSLVPLSRDALFPTAFARINARFKTPHNSLILTGAFIVVALFLKLEILVETASVVLILTNIFACISVVILRESRLQNYQPSFRAPFYPWLQIVGILGFGFLLFEMRGHALLTTAFLIGGGLLIYWSYGRIRGRREYALLHLIERITAKEFTAGSLELELREIIRERDGIIKDRFDGIVEKSVVLDIQHFTTLEEFFKMVSRELAQRLTMSSDSLYQSLLERESEDSTALDAHLAIPHIIVDGEREFDILLARCREGIHFSEVSPAVRAVFVLVGTRDQRNFHLRVLSAIAQITQEPHFEQRWMSARNKDALRDIILLGKRRRRGE